MAKYKCKICGEIYDEEIEGTLFNDLPDDWVCPKCFVPKFMFEKVIEEEHEEEINPFKKAIPITADNPAIERIKEKCIDCGMCTSICQEREGISNICNGKLCVHCGQCIQACPTGALIPKRDKDKLLKALADGKTCIAYTSPSVRVAIGDEFGMAKGTFAQGKLITALRNLGFSYVLDVTFGADLTIMEEASELVNRINNNGKLPMFTSCCPAWIKYAELFYPEILGHISTCKSPIGMQGEVVKNYFAEKKKLNKENVFTVAITPCTAKKYEVARDEIGGTDLVLTVQEITSILKEKKIDISSLEDGEYDSLLGEGSGAAMIFGNTGGVMEAALREVYYMLTETNLEKDDLVFTSVRGMDNVKEASIQIKDTKYQVAVVHTISAAKQILDDVKNGNSKYHYIEIMNCLGGCIGGGGQPKTLPGTEVIVKEKRVASLYEKDLNSKYRVSHENPDIIRIYGEYLKYPCSEKAEQLLHTTYTNRSDLVK